MLSTRPVNRPGVPSARITCTRWRWAGLALEAKFGHLPSGGWGWVWAGDPNRGFGAKQPGGWHYNILPFIDLADLHDLGKGLPEGSVGDLPPTMTRNAQGQIIGRTPVAVFHCPSRTKVQVFPRNHGTHYCNITDPMPFAGRSDYAANAGSNYYNVPGSPNTGYDPKYNWSGEAQTLTSGTAQGGPCTGVVCVAGEVTMSMIKDGASNTYLIGERYLNPDCYYTTGCCDNDQGWIEGFDWDTNRGTGLGYIKPSDLPTATQIPPAQDRPGFSTHGGCSWNFGSAHQAGVNMAFCDGVVRKISYDIDPNVHMQLGHRADGEPTQLQLITGSQ